MDIKTGYFQSDGNAVNIILGFVPDFLELIEDTEATSPFLFKWSKSYSESGLTDVFGWLLTGTTGIVTCCADGANGIEAFDESGVYVMIESPVPGKGNIATAAPVFTEALSTAGTARTGTAIGQIVRPPVRNGYVYEMTVAGTYAAEPVWPTTPGESVMEAGGDVYWTCRNEHVVRGGGKGFTFGATAQTDGHYVHFKAVRTDKDRYIGNADDGDLSMV